MSNAGPQICAPDTMSLEEKVGQIIIGRQLDWPNIEQDVADGIVSGMTPKLSGKPLTEIAEWFNHLQSLSKHGLIIGWSGICYSGGTDLRLSQCMRIAATRSADLAYQAGKIEATEARAIGFNLGAAPNLDVNTNPDNPIINLRSFGDQPDLVIEMGQAVAQGVLDGGCLTVAMHWPGHGSTARDSHLCVPVVERTREELEAVDMHTFRTVMKTGVLKTICTNHCLYPALDDNPKNFATISGTIITDLLRKGAGYEGVILSDSLTMQAIQERYGIEEAAILAVASGHDLILQDYKSDPRITHTALVKAVRDRRIPIEQIDASVRRVLELKKWLGLFGYRTVDPASIPDTVGCEAHKAVARQIARESVTVLENQGIPVSATPSLKCVVISNGSVATIEEDMNISHTPANQALNAAVRHRLPNTQTAVLPLDPVASDIQAAAALAEEADLVIFGIFTRARAYAEHGIRLHLEYKQLIARITGMANRTVLLNLGNPWNTADLPKPDISLCTYSDAEDSIEAAVAVIFGEINAQGKLPITLSKEYPFGYGL